MDATYEYSPTKHGAPELAELFGLIHTAFERHAHAFCEALGDVPARRYRELVSKFPVRIPRSQKEFDIEWSLRHSRVIGRYGIEFEGRYYSSKELGLLKNSMGAGPYRVLIHVMPEDIRTVYVRGSNGDFIEVPCVQQSDEPLPLEIHLLRRSQRRRHSDDEDARIADAASDRIETVAESVRDRSAQRKANELSAQAQLRRVKKAVGQAGKKREEVPSPDVSGLETLLAAAEERLGRASRDLAELGVGDVRPLRQDF